ncbi:hypothetical protein LTR28_006287 [Elasticomyces elasticus]|nr:hypothetical protein LTR28_006287 [Elasticomyces elasticus]
MASEISAGNDASGDDPANTKTNAHQTLLSSFPAGSPAATIDIPVPALTLDFRMSVQLNPKISVGGGPWGQRNWISFSGGMWAATWGSGTVVPGGQDTQLVLHPSLSTHISTSYLLRTADTPPAHITARTSGWRTGPAGVLARLADPAQADGVDPREYLFRVVVRLETGDARYKERVNTGVW